MPPRQQQPSVVSLEQKATQAGNLIQQRVAAVAQLADAAGRSSDAATSAANTVVELIGHSDVQSQEVPTLGDLAALKEAMLEFLQVTSQHAHAVRQCASACMDVARNAGYPQGAMSAPPPGQAPPPPASPFRPTTFRSPAPPATPPSNFRGKASAPPGPSAPSSSGAASSSRAGAGSLSNPVPLAAEWPSTPPLALDPEDEDVD